MERRLVANRLMCMACGDLIQSFSRHDFVTCKCGMCTTDGGLEYLHRSYKNPDLAQDFSIYSDQPFNVVRAYAYRKGYGKPGSVDYGKFRVTLLKDMTNERLEASLVYRLVTPGSFHWRLLLEEKLYRIENEIYIED